LIETENSVAALASTASADPHKQATVRLVIRARILPDAARTSPSAASKGFDTRSIALIIGVLALLILAWIMGVFRRDSISADAVNEHSAPAPVHAAAQVESVPANPVVSASGRANATATEPPGKLDAPTSSIHEVMPAASRSALQTIHGTIKVSIRVAISKDGAVQTATSHIPGPSRYFERLALQAAKKWTFTPTSTQEPRTRLVQFYFTREGVTGRLASDGS
jgi:TonB family protein